MDRETFLKKLRETPRDWYLRPGYVDSRKQVIRRRNSQLAGEHCPITCVHGQVLSSAFWLNASRDLGLQHRTAKAIACAADDEPTNVKIRAEILKACGLSETP